MAQGRSHLSFTPSPYHPLCSVVFEFLHFTFYFFLLFSFLFLSFFLMSDFDDDSVTTTNLRDSANGTFVTLDDYLPLTFYLPWCHGLVEREGVVPQLYAENLKCASRDSGDLLAAAQSTSRYIRLVGQDAAPCKCVLLGTCSKTL